jgi:cell division FtsZ-interacting protein ZapD
MFVEVKRNRKPDAAKVRALCRQIAPVLAGQHPAEIGSCLADLLATFIISHHPAEVRERLLEDTIALVRQLMPVNEQLTREFVRRTGH